jgi:type IV secretion system protein VirB10
MDLDPNSQVRKNAFLDSQGASKTTDILPARLQHPRSPYEVKGGTIIPAVLITGINSDLPGPVIGQVRESVYDTVSGNYLLIPQGSRLLAQYDSMVAWGQERVLVCWNRLVFPNGDSIDLECMPAADLAGAAGLADGVDEHWGRILKGAAVATLLAATTTVVAGNTQGFNPTVPQTLARNAAGEMNAIGQRITAQNLNIQPTITVRPGFSVNVIVTKDLVLPAPYAGDPPPERNKPHVSR